ncbi:MAG: LolA family protein [Thalassotalea sp.]
MRIIALMASFLFLITLSPAKAELNEEPNAEKGANEFLSAEQAVNLLKLAPNLALSGQFIQKKHFKILKKPFISQGEFNVNDQQFTWRTLTPIKSAVIFKDNTLYLENAKGELSKQNKAQNIGYLMQQLLSGQFKQLSQYFSITATTYTDEQKPCLVLLATNNSFAQVFKQIRLCGEGNISTISLYDPQANATDITLSYEQAADITNESTNH